MTSPVVTAIALVGLAWEATVFTLVYRKHRRMNYWIGRAVEKDRKEKP